jgi:hypothetical protein
MDDVGDKSACEDGTGAAAARGPYFLGDDGWKKSALHLERWEQGIDKQSRIAARSSGHCCSPRVVVSPPTLLAILDLGSTPVLDAVSSGCSV